MRHSPECREQVYKAMLTEDAQDTFFYEDERRGLNKSLTELVASGELRPSDLKRASRPTEPFLGSGKILHRDHTWAAGMLEGASLA